ncbi:hypothetical protein CH1034_170034 [Klebsiella pneumoniae]|nr:hypothetical protein CH1034_170034 [Klebsiella pneumoniae]
MHVATRIYKKK